MTDTNTSIDFIDAFSEQVITKVIADNCDSFASSLGCKDHYLHMKRENLAESAFWRAKKCYAMRVNDSEGLRYSEPHMKITGLEYVKSSTPKIVADWLMEGYSLILDEVDDSELMNFIKDKYDEYCKLPVSEIAIPIKADSKMFEPGAVIDGKGPHIRGGHLFNKLLTEHKLSDPPVTGGKIRFVLLKNNNSYKADSLAFNTNIPDEFDLVKYMDYKAMFEKSFLVPLVTCCEATGRNISRNINQIKSASTLSAFF